MISAEAAKPLHAMLSQTIDSMSLLMVPTDPVYSVLAQSKSALTSMLELIEQQKTQIAVHNSEIVSYQILTDGLKKQIAEQSGTIAAFKQKVVDLEDAGKEEALPVKANLSSKWMEVAQKWQAKASERKKEIDSLKEQLESAQASAVYNGQKKVDHFQKWKQTQAALETCQEKLELAEKNFLASDTDYQAFYSVHVQTLAQKDAEIKALQDAKTVPQEKYEALTVKYNNVMLWWSQAQDAKKKWADEADKFKQKYMALLKRMVMVESITAEMRSLVVDAIAWGEQRQEEVFQTDSFGYENYQSLHVDEGKKWFFRVKVQREVMQHIVERNDAIRDKWADKVKELADA